MSNCIWCGARHDTPLVLCPSCEALAFYLKAAKGEPPK